MPVVPTEENRVGIAGVTGEKLVPGDFSGSGLDALGAGMQSLGEAGRKVAVAQHERALEDDAAVKKAWNNYSVRSRMIGADFYARQGSDAVSALQPATDALRETVDGLRDGLIGRRQRGIFDRSLPDRLIADVAKMEDYVAAQKVVDQQKQSIGVKDNAGLDAVENAGNPVQFQKHVHTGIETMRTQALLQGRDPASVNHEAAHFLSSIHRDVADGLIVHDALAAHQYLLDKGGEMIASHRDDVARSLAPVLGEQQAVADVDTRDALRSPNAPTTPPGDIATVTGRMLTVESARQAKGGGAPAAAALPGPADGQDTTSGNAAPPDGAKAAHAAGLSALMLHYRGDAAKAWAASLQGQAPVDALVANHGDAWFGALPEDARKAVAANMTLLGAATSPRIPPTPEEHASTSSWIQGQGWKDDRKQLAHEELHKRIGLANRQRTEAQNAAKETALALTHKLGPGFTSVNQIPPAVRRDLPDDALAALALRADRNVHPVTVAPNGDVVTRLNRMAATDPEGFAKEDLRLSEDRMTPGEYASLERTQQGLASYPPAPLTIMQRHLWDEIRQNGLDDDPANGGDAVTPSPDEALVDHLASAETIPEALRGTDATKGAVREMLRRDWTPDQVQNQLYEAYVRRSIDPTNRSEGMTGGDAGPVGQGGALPGQPGMLTTNFGQAPQPQLLKTGAGQALPQGIPWRGIGEGWHLPLPEISPEKIARNVGGMAVDELRRRLTDLQHSGASLAAKTAAMATVTLAINDPFTTPLAARLLMEWRDGTSKTTRANPEIFGPDSAESNELLFGDTGEYYRHISDLGIAQLASAGGGKIRPGAPISVRHIPPYGTMDGINGMADGINVGDTIGTFTYGVTAEVRGHNIYFTGRNAMTLGSFSGENKLRHGQVANLDHGRFSNTYQTFVWRVPIPRNFDR